MKNKFLEILKDAYPQGFSPLYTSGASLQLWREEMAFALEAAAQHNVQRIGLRRWFSAMLGAIANR